MSAVEASHVFDQAKPCQLRPGPLKGAAGYVVLAFQVGKVRHYGVGPFQLKKYPRCSVLLVAVPWEEHLHYLGEIRYLADPPVAELDLRGFCHVSASPLVLEAESGLLRGTS